MYNYSNMYQKCFIVNIFKVHPEALDKKKVEAHFLM